MLRACTTDPCGNPEHHRRDASLGTRRMDRPFAVRRWRRSWVRPGLDQRPRRLPSLVPCTRISPPLPPSTRSRPAKTNKPLQKKREKNTFLFPTFFIFPSGTRSQKKHTPEPRRSRPPCRPRASAPPGPRPAPPLGGWRRGEGGRGRRGGPRSPAGEASRSCRRRGGGEGSAISPEPAARRRRRAGRLPGAGAPSDLNGRQISRAREASRSGLRRRG